MRKKRKNKLAGRQISFTPIIRYCAVFCVLTMIIVLSGGFILAFSRMKADARTSMNSAHAVISQRVGETVNLLEALASLPEFYDPEIPPIIKVKKLDQMTGYFGYMMICYVDDEITVYSDGEEPASLASRDYMQKLFSTGQRQVTDSFAAGADGVTLNYTVAVPLFDDSRRITGCLFSAIYFDEIEEILKASTGVNGTEAALIGSRGQIMSSTTGMPYGDSIMEALRDSVLLGTTADHLEEQMLARVPGAFFGIRDGNLYYTMYQRVENTGWDILCSINLREVFADILPGLLFMGALTVTACAGLLFAVRRLVSGQMKVVELLVHSVEELEKKIYQDECPENLDFNEIIRLTSDGLSDSLTGVVTRSVFFNQAAAQLKKAASAPVNALCFIDLDNLKYINDTLGHNGGDIALKSVGYILREYEKKYDGVAGRYGGDEFVLLLIGLEDEAELHSVLDGLILRLHSDIGSAGRRIPIQCSVGVALCRPDSDLEQVVADADEALYFVKQNGKGYYKIHQN